MPNGVAKPDEFDAATKVMESGLLRVLKSETSDLDELAPPTQPEVAATAPPTPPPQAQPARRSRIFVIAGIVAAVAVAFDASLFLFHPRREMRPAAVIAAPEPMPKYMLVPLDAPPLPAPVEPAVAPAPPTTTVVTTATTERPVLAVRSHRHSRHRHGSR